MKRSTDERVFSIIGGLFITLFSIICVLPFISILSGSISSEELITLNGYSLIPRGLSFEAYKTIFADPTVILRSYGVTIFITAASVVSGLFVTSMTAYVLCRKNFLWRNAFALFFYFTCLFSGGMVPSYILMISLGMKDNILALIIGFFFSTFNALIIRNYMSSLPDSLIESAKMDGAGEFTIFVRIMFPLSTPVLATVALFIGLGCWNSWSNAMLFINDERLYPLQYLLYQILNSITSRQRMMAAANAAINTSVMAKPPEETVKLATTIIVTGPIIFVYPFVQKYFVKGIMIGAVKG